MSTAGVLCGLFWALGATGGPTPAAGGGRTIEILIAGPEAARNRMDAAIRPLFTGASDIHWTAEANVPVDGALPASGGPGPPQASQGAQIWIDVSSPSFFHIAATSNAVGYAVVPVPLPAQMETLVGASAEKMGAVVSSVMA